MAKEESVKTIKKTVKPAIQKPVIKSVKKDTGKKVVNKEEIVKTVPAKPAKKVAKDSAVADVVKSEAKVSDTVKVKTYKSVSIDVIGIDGKVTDKISLPGEIFGESVNKALIAQAVRVYLANQRQGTVSTKTRGEVEGSTAKIYRQKGTGRARHGSKRAPIFVKGGVVFGPKPRNFSLSLPQKMKRKSLFSVLSAKVTDKELTVIDGLQSVESKTKKFAQMLKKLGFEDKKQKLLFVTSGDVTSVLRAGRNIQGLQFIPSKLINTYEVLNANRIILMKESIADIKEHFLKK